MKFGGTRGNMKGGRNIRREGSEEGEREREEGREGERERARGTEV